MGEEVIGWRRHLHHNPELSFQEEETSRFVYETLDSFGGLELSRPTPTSVAARQVGERPGRVVALRAYMNALPIEEQNDFEFASKNPGVMHACGHDGPTAMLLGAAEVLVGMREEINGEVRFLFQHAEELYPGGAEEMVDAGVTEGVDAILGIHLWSGPEFGKIGVVYGPMLAAPDTFEISISGRGGHATMPHQTADAIAIGAQVVANLQHGVSRFLRCAKLGSRELGHLVRGNSNRRDGSGQRYGQQANRACTYDLRRIPSQAPGELSSSTK